MTKKTRLIPFDLQKALNGAKVVTGHGETLIELHYFEKRTHSKLVGVFKSERSAIYAFEDDGKHFHTEYNLYIEEELEEKTFYVNVYKEGHGFNTHDTLPAAQRGADRNLGSLGILKVTYTDEDLIK
jgi:hypothetical protein